MCYPATCDSCGKSTWAGCGNQIESVKAQVPAGQWCTCSDDATPDSTNIGSILSSIFKR